MALSLKDRYKILKRDHFMCLYCGGRPPAVELQVDHVVSRANGGTDHPCNLITACAPCNQGKKTENVTCCLDCVRPLCCGPMSPRDSLEAGCGCRCHACPSCLSVGCPVTDSGACIDSIVAEAEHWQDVSAEEGFSF